MAIMTQNVAATTEIRRLGARMRDSSGPMADDESGRIEPVYPARHDHRWYV